MPDPCPDCGEYPVNHPSEWFSALFESAFAPVSAGVEHIIRGVKPVVMRHAPDSVALPFLRMLTAIRLGTIKTDVDEYDSGRNRWLWDAAKRRGIEMYHFRLLGKPDGTDFFVVRYGAKTVAFEGLPRPDRGVSKSLDWMDNKAILKKRLTAAGIPMARGRACRTYEQALATMREVGRDANGAGGAATIPVITKPHIGSRSRHSTIGIRTPEELRVGFDKAKRLSPWVIVEQELQGYLFRVLLVRGEIAAIIRREQAYVTGDGTSTIRELIERENKNPRRNGPTFHQLPTDETVDEELIKKALNRDSVPPRGEIVILNPHISRYYGGSTSDFTNRVHPDNANLFRHLAAVLGDSLVGVDFIIGDMEKSWHEQKLCGVIECNSLPNIDLHHDVLYGESRDIGGLLLDIAFEK
jgi:D-alanine-D-alanine ligase-like ATP-grasp enzyme